MPAEDPDLKTKLATLRTMQREGTSPRVAELVLIEWPQPDLAIYYATKTAADLLDNIQLLDRLDGAEIELRLGSGIFLDVSSTAGIGDDKIELDFWEGDDDELTRLTQTHGAGMRVEAFYYFPDVDLLLSEWWGHLQPPDAVDADRFKASAQSGFRSFSISLPSRGFFSGCQAMFGGLLTTQAEIDEGDCPYSLHLAGTPGAGSFATDDTWLQTLTPGTEDWTALVYDDSGWDPAVEQGAIGTAPWTWGNGPPPFPPDAVASWIWDHDSRSMASFDTATVYFRKAFTAASASALLVLTGDNSFTAFLNGVQVVFGSDWQQGYSALLTLEEGEDYVLAVKVVNGEATVGFQPSPGGLLGVLLYDVEGIGFGETDPDTSQPFVSCPRNNRAVCIARLGDDRSFLAFDSIIESHVVNETKGPNINVTSRGNETNLSRALRLVFGKRHVADLDLLQFVVEPNTNHPDQGSVKCLYAVAEGRNKSVTNLKIKGQTIAAEHSNYRVGAKRQPPTSYSPNVLNYSGTALALGVAQGDFTQATADDLSGECDVEGKDDCRIYTDEQTYTLGYTTERGWALLECLRNKRCGYGLDARRVHIPDFLDIGGWLKEVVTVKDKDGNVFTGPRSQFNAELIGRSTQQQIEDICSAGRLSLPFHDKGKLRVVPLRRASELFSVSVFVDKAFFGTLVRAATDEEREEWFDALLEARADSPAALLAECTARVVALFESDLYDDRDRTDEEFVADCYMAFLRRVPEAEGAAFWLGQLVATSRTHLLEAFSVSIEFLADCSDSDVPTFSDRGVARNICVDSEGGKSTLTYSIQPDDVLPNRIVLNFDDAAHENKQVPLTFEDVDQQLRAGRAFGDTSRRSVPKDYTAFGVTDGGEAGRLGNLLLDLGEYDEGGLKNNLRFSFTTWYLETVGLHAYQVVKIDAAKLDTINAVRVSQGLEEFTYFRIRSLQRLPDLKVEVSVQAYPVEYYERLELLTQAPPITPSGPPDDDPFDPDFPGPGRGRIPFQVGLESVGHNDDQIFFQIGRTEV